MQNLKFGILFMTLLASSVVAKRYADTERVKTERSQNLVFHGADEEVRPGSYLQMDKPTIFKKFASKTLESFKRYDCKPWMNGQDWLRNNNGNKDHQAKLCMEMHICSEDCKLLVEAIQGIEWEKEMGDERPVYDAWCESLFKANQPAKNLKDFTCGECQSLMRDQPEDWLFKNDKNKDRQAELCEEMGISSGDCELLVAAISEIEWDPDANERPVYDAWCEALWKANKAKPKSLLEEEAEGKLPLEMRRKDLLTKPSDPADSLVEDKLATLLDSPTKDQLSSLKETKDYISLWPAQCDWPQAINLEDDAQPLQISVEGFSCHAATHEIHDITQESWQNPHHICCMGICMDKKAAEADKDCSEALPPKSLEAALKVTGLDKKLLEKSSLVEEEAENEEEPSDPADSLVEEGVVQLGDKEDEKYLVDKGWPKDDADEAAKNLNNNVKTTTGVEVAKPGYHIEKLKADGLLNVVAKALKDWPTEAKSTWKKTRNGHVKGAGKYDRTSDVKKIQGWKADQVAVMRSDFPLKTDLEALFQLIFMGMKKLPRSVRVSNGKGSPVTIAYSQRRKGKETKFVDELSQHRAAGNFNVYDAVTKYFQESLASK